jgi:hypothetical protein
MGVSDRHPLPSPVSVRCLREDRDRVRGMFSCNEGFEGGGLG